jgi:type IV pilus assembly protein PilB
MSQYSEEFLSFFPAAKQSSALELLQNIFHYAIVNNSSDIHFESFKEHLRIRIRIDSVLYEIAKIAWSIGERFIIRMKIMSKLDIAENRLPQDGRFTIVLADTSIKECRISSCPTFDGEKLVVRILHTANRLSLPELGLNEHECTILLQNIAAPLGLILFSGPTGSGKTVSLYSILNLLNDGSKSIAAVEDPIEMPIYGINQLAVNAKIGLTFAKALRSILRQDPDVIMIGEIRDYETAHIAIKAAETGHLVLATIHANSGWATIDRLRNLGIAISNLRSSLQLIINQRLVRRVCPHCKLLKEIDSQAKQYIAKYNLSYSESMNVATAVGCYQCCKGYLGRVGIFEFITIAETIDVIGNREKRDNKQTDIRTDNAKLAIKIWEKIIIGITTIAEMRRVLG